MPKFTEESLLASLDSLVPVASMAKLRAKSEKLFPLKPQTSMTTLSWTIEETKKALVSVKTDSFEQEFGSDLNVQIWSQVLHFITDLKETLMNAIPRFWKICCLYLESKGLWIPPRQLEAALEARRSHCNTMIRNIIMVLETMIGQILRIKFKSNQKSVGKVVKLQNSPSTANGDELYLDSSSGQPKNEIIEKEFKSILDNMKEFRLVNADSYLQAHPLIIVHYSGQIVHALNGCINDMQSFYTLGEATLLNSFNETVEKVSTYLLERVSSEWINRKL